jgi:WD40 repeat protein
LNEIPSKGYITGHTNWVSQIAFLFGGNYIVSGSDDTTIRCKNDKKKKKEIKI